MHTLQFAFYTHTGSIEANNPISFYISSHQRNYPKTTTSPKFNHLPLQNT